MTMEACSFRSYHAQKHHWNLQVGRNQLGKSLAKNRRKLEAALFNFWPGICQSLARFGDNFLEFYWVPARIPIFLKFTVVKMEPGQKYNAISDSDQKTLQVKVLGRKSEKVGFWPNIYLVSIQYCKFQ